MKMLGIVGGYGVVIVALVLFALTLAGLVGWA